MGPDNYDWAKNPVVREAIYDVFPEVSRLEDWLETNKDKTGDPWDLADYDLNSRNCAIFNYTMSTATSNFADLELKLHGAGVFEEPLITIPKPSSDKESPAGKPFQLRYIASDGECSITLNVTPRILKLAVD
ncbi:MAG: hypothetical protein ABIH34_06630 [Nanoarchaeota archaeon]